MIINEPEESARALKVVKKLWGTELWIVNEKLYCLKYLKLIPGYQCSIHAHKKKSETFIGIAGNVMIAFHDATGRTEKVVGLGPGDTVNMPAKQYHSFQANNVSWFAEVSTHHDDADVIRLQESRKLEP